MSTSKHNRYREVNVIFTKHMPLSKEAHAEIKKATPSAKFFFLDLKTPEDPNFTNIKNLQQRNEGVLANFVEEHKDGLHADFLILSLFIDQVCSVFPKHTRKILLFYDLIPLQYNKRYSGWAGYKNYLARFKTLLESDLILTISQTVADDLVTELGIAREKLSNIDGAPIKRNHREPSKPNLPLPKRYILMPSGDELRKNNLRAVQGFKKFKESQPEDIFLLATSFFNDATKKELLEISSDVIFTGNVSETELQWLYNHCEAVLFVPEYEGLGLPILEAIEARKPVVCSNITVFNEMSTTAFYYADQLDPLSIADAIAACLSGRNWEKRKEEYPSVEARYTWEQTARKTLEFLERSPRTIQSRAKPRVAVFMPNPNGYSSIGRIGILLHAELSSYFEVDYYLEDGKSQKEFSRPSYLPYVAQTYKASEFNARRYAGYDAVVYHMGNSEYHLETIKNALYLPGYVILHDTYLKNIFEGELTQYGYVSQDRALAEQSLDTMLKSSRSSYITSIVNSQRGVLVHSDYAVTAVGRVLLGASKVPIRKINLPTGTPKMSGMKLKEQFNIGFAGTIHEAKGIEALEKIIMSSAASSARVYIFGIPIISRVHCKDSSHIRMLRYRPT